MILDKEASLLFEEYNAALQEEAAAINAIVLYSKNGDKKSASLEALIKKMEVSHDTALKFYDRLQPFRLDMD